MYIGHELFPLSDLSLDKGNCGADLPRCAQAGNTLAWGPAALHLEGGQDLNCVTQTSLKLLADLLSQAPNSSIGVISMSHRLSGSATLHLEVVP